jgi:hypothetical protein
MFIIIALSTALLNINFVAGDATTLHAHSRRLSESGVEINWEISSPDCLVKDADLTTVEDSFGICENFKDMEQSMNKCVDLRKSLQCWVSPGHDCDAQKFRDTCRSRIANFPECASCLCEEDCAELDVEVLSDVILDFWALIQLYLIFFVLGAVAVELIFLLFCYHCCPAQCCRSMYWCICCIQPWCCMEEYCRLCPCCRPCLTCCLPNYCGYPPKRTYAGIELAMRWTNRETAMWGNGSFPLFT